MDTCPTCGRIGGALRPHLLLDSEELCPRGAPGDYPPDDPADLEGREDWGPEQSNSGDPGEWADEPDEVPAPLPETLPELPEPPAPKAKRGRKARAEPAPTVEDLLTRVAGDAFQMLCPVESCRSEVTAVFDGKRLVLAEHNHPRHLGRCPCVVVPRKHWPPELTRAALERAGEWMVGEAADPGLASLFEPMTNVTGPGAVLTREALEAGDAALRADVDRVPWIYTESIAITGDMAPTSVTVSPASEAALPTVLESRPDAARALAKTICPEHFTPEGGYTRGEVMTYRAAWEVGISEAVALEPTVLPSGKPVSVGQLFEPACNFPMDGTEPHAKALVLEMIPHGDGGWVKWHRVPREAFACTENTPAEVTPAQARLYLGRLTDGDAVRAVRGYLEKARGEDDLPPISTPEPPPLAGTGDVWAEIIALEPEPALREVFAARRQFGIDKYGTPLQRDNGRDHNNDLAQELCDGIVYARAAERPATETILRDLLFHGEAYAEDVTNFGAALRGIYRALGVSDLTVAHQRIDAMRQAEKGLEQVLSAAGEGSTAVGVARELGRKLEPVTAEPPPVEGVSFSGIITAVGGFEPTVTVTARVDVETCKAAGHLLYQSVRVVLPVEGEEP